MLKIILLPIGKTFSTWTYFVSDAVIYNKNLWDSLHHE